MTVNIYNFLKGKLKLELVKILKMSEWLNLNFWQLLTMKINVQ